MAAQIPIVPEQLSGTQRQLTPDDLQLVDGETQTLTQAPMPLIELAEPEKREPPGPVSPYGPESSIVSSGATGAGGVLLFPIVRLSRYLAHDTAFVTLLSWDIPDGYFGDLKEISLKSNADANTRYRLTIGGVDMQIPTDRPTSTPLTMKFPTNSIPGPTNVTVEVLSVDGTDITVDAMITGALKTLP